MEAALRGKCQVQLAPYSKAGVALDSSYALQCLHMFLTTIDLTPTHYDVVVFNFGLHDIDYLEKYPEVRYYSNHLPIFDFNLFQKLKLYLIDH